MQFLQIYIYFNGILKSNCVYTNNVNVDVDRFPHFRCTGVLYVVSCLNLQHVFLLSIPIWLLMYFQLLKVGRQHA